jgi:hypothetical protein
VAMAVSMLLVLLFQSGTLGGLQHGCVHSRVQAIPVRSSQSPHGRGLCTLEHLRANTSSVGS